MSRRIEARVVGRVQGVFFRDSALEQANRLGLTGWVSNERDGSLAVEAQGDREAVAALVTWLHDGPPQARVDHVEVTEIASITDEQGFVVR